MRKSYWAVVALMMLGCSESHDDGNLCGNGVIDPGEMCDTQMTPIACQLLDAGKTWEDGGAAACSNDCRKVLTGTCKEKTLVTGVCGDGVKNTGEKCDGTDGATCNDLDPTKSWQDGGAAVCSKDCRELLPGTCKEKVIETDSCGDGKVSGSEVCDTKVKLTCADVDGSKEWIDGGEPECAADCLSIKPGTCREKAIGGTCGDGTVNIGEKCDTKAVTSCMAFDTSKHWVSGEAACSEDCKNISVGTCVEAAADSCQSDDDCKNNDTAKKCDLTTHLCVLPGCTSNDECSINMPICNTTKGECEKCDPADDKCGDGKVCTEAGACIAKCTDNSGCTDVSNPVCNDRGICEKCDPADDKCGEGRVCADDGKCIDKCVNDDNCKNPEPICNKDSGKCEKCTSDAQCGDNSVCTNGACGAKKNACNEDKDCADNHNGKFCNKNNQCVQCVSDAQCDSKGKHYCNPETFVCEADMSQDCTDLTGSKTGLYWCQVVNPLKVQMSDSSKAADLNVKYKAAADVDESKIKAELVYGTDFKKLASAWKKKTAVVNTDKDSASATIQSSDLGGINHYFAFRLSTDDGKTWKYCKASHEYGDALKCDLKPYEGKDMTTDPVASVQTTGHITILNQSVDKILAQFTFDSGKTTTDSSYFQGEGSYAADGGSLKASAIFDAEKAWCNNAAAGGCFTNGADKGVSLKNWKKDSNDALKNGAYMLIKGINTTGLNGINLDIDIWRNAEDSPKDMHVVLSKDGGKTFDSAPFSISIVGTKIKEYKTFNIPLADSDAANQADLAVKLVPYGGSGYLRIDNIIISHGNAKAE